MTIDFLVKNLDLLDADHVEMACGILRARHRQATMQLNLFGWDEARVRADIAARPSASLVPMSGLQPVDEPAVDTATEQGVSALFQGQTRAFLERMIDTIRSKGGVTLEDAAALHGIGVDTARAYIRNAGRTAKAHTVAVPVKPTWDHDKGCNVYGV